MKELDQRAGGQEWKARLLRGCLFLLGIVAIIALSIVLESKAGIPFKTTYRVACAIGCLIFLANIGSDYPGERWPRIALLVALLFNIALFFSPFARLPESKGDLLFFAAPDAAIMLVARIATYRVTDVHQRAVRQQMILGLFVALVLCAILGALMFDPPHTGR